MHSVKLTSGCFKPVHLVTRCKKTQNQQQNKNPKQTKPQNPKTKPTSPLPPPPQTTFNFALFTGMWGNKTHQTGTVQEEREGFAFNEPALYSAPRVCVRALVLEHLTEHLFLCYSAEGCGLSKGCPQMVF